jgi:hypothetical protein
LLLMFSELGITSEDWERNLKQCRPWYSPYSTNCAYSGFGREWTEVLSRAYSTCCKFSAILTPFTKTTL